MRIWCKLNHLHLRTSNTKEKVVAYWKTKHQLWLVFIEGVDVKVVQATCLELQLDDNLHRKEQRSICFLRRLGSFWCHLLAALSSVRLYLTFAGLHVTLCPVTANF